MDRIGFIFLFALLGMLSSARAETINLDFYSLPSNQGWTYVGNSLQEEISYSTDGVTLTQTTADSGSNYLAYYRIDNIVNPSDEMNLSFTARVLVGSNQGRGFNFRIRDRWVDYSIALTDNSVIVNKKSYKLDTSMYHDYVFATRPSGQVNHYELFVDGSLVMQGGAGSGVLDNFISFGDSSNAENSNAEITALSFTATSGAMPDIDVEMAVDNAFPNKNDTIEFTVTARNIGVTSAENIVIVDLLPEELSVPNDSLAFTSIGNYDPTNGEWTIDSLDIGDEAILVIPALVTEINPPDCIANFASSNHIRDFNTVNNEAHAVIQANDNRRCVDLGVKFSISNSELFYSGCDANSRYIGSVDVTNYGPDTAHNVVVTVSQEPTLGPHLRFEDINCLNTSRGQCSLPDLASGESISILVTSDLYKNYHSVEQILSVSAKTNDFDYKLSNNNPSVIGTARGFSNCDLLDGIFESTSASSTGCFIATAAYGTPIHPDIDYLRNFRDKYMMTNRPGRAVVDLYYQYSPALADYITEREWLRTIVRWLLTPIVYMIKLPLIALMLITALIVTGIVRRRRRFLQI